MKHTIMSSMIAALLLSNPVCAITDPASDARQLSAPIAAGQQETEPAMLLDEGMGKMLAFMNQKDRPGKEALAAFLDAKISSFFDFDYMSKSAAGPMYRHMQPQQRERMADKIKQQFLATMTERLAGYDSQQVRVLSQRYGRRGNVAKVSVAVLQPRGYPARLDFRFYRAKSGWKVFDVSANGQSAVIHYRRQFRQMMYATRTDRHGFDDQGQRQRSYQ